MCGIAGVYAYRETAPPVDGGELLRIRDAMEKRGPDGAGLWIAPDARVGLAHRRLAVIDTGASGAQPMATADGRLRVTFNGEIYNYRELKRELEAKGFRFQSNSDTEVLLHLYADRGADMVHALRGMYAFGIWDEAQKHLFLARDPFGIKPLYYSDHADTFRFASQVKALMRGGAIPDTMEEAGYVGFYIWGSVPEPYTLYRKIRALPAGTCMVVDANGVGASARFFDIRNEFGSAREPGDLLQALQESIGYHMVADVPVGAYLSAGLDSATLSALAAGAARDDLRTITLGFREYVGTPNDETGLAQQVAERYGARHDTRWITRSDFESELDTLLAAMDQPSIDGVNTYFVSKAAASAGMKVAISGIGGDELFGGYPSFSDVPRLKRFAGAVGSSPGVSKALRRVLSPVARRFTSPKYAGMLEYGGSYGGAYLLRRGLYMPWELTDVLDPEIAARGWEELRTLAVLEDGVRGVTTERQIVAALEMRWYMRNQLLRDSDWAGMAHSVEIRLPYVDVPFFRAVAPLMSSSRAPSKADLALRLQPSMPDAVIYRNKTGFIVPLREWCMELSAGRYAERGLRGWAKLVMQRSAVSAGVLSSAHTARSRVSMSFAASVCASAGGSRPAIRWPSSDTAVSRRARSRHWWRRAQSACAHALYQSVNASLAGLATMLWPADRPQQARRVCIFRIGNIGDIACALPAMRNVREAYPHAHVTLLTSPGPQGRPGAMELWPALDWINEVLVYHTRDIATVPQRWSLLRELRSRRFDVWIELPNNLSTVSRQVRDMVFTRMLGVRWARGWQIGTIRWAAQAQSEHLRFTNEVERLLGILAHAGIPVTGVEHGLAKVPEAAAKIDRLLKRAGLEKRRLVALAPGAKRSTNRWPAERFADVGRALAAQGCSVLVIGGTAERTLCEALARAIGDGAQTWAGDLSVLESCELLRRCALLVGVDSGVQHLAAAVGTPCVSLFSFWQMLGKWRPHGEKHTVIQKWVSCHTCLMEECPRGNRCMTEITVPEVIRAAHEVMAA